MELDQIATKKFIEETEERMMEFFLSQFELLKQELRLQKLKTAIEPRLTKKEVMLLLNVKSVTTNDKWERSGRITVEDWGEVGKKRSPRYPKNQFDNWNKKAA